MKIRYINMILACFISYLALVHESTNLVWVFMIAAIVLDIFTLLLARYVDMEINHEN